MARFRIAFIFSLPDHGAAETWYVERADESLFLLNLELLNLCQKRAACLGTGAALKALRISLVQDNTGAKVTRVAKSFRKNIPGTAAGTAAVSTLSLQVTASTADQRRTKIWPMVGCPMKIFPGGEGLDLGQADFRSLFNSFSAVVQEKHLGWVAQTKTEAVDISSYVIDPATGKVKYTLGADLFVNAEKGKTIKVGVDFPLTKSPLDGVQLVIPRILSEATTAKARPAAGTYTLGRMWKYTYAFADLGAQNVQGNPSTILPTSPMERKRGRPLLVSAGRRAPRPVW